MPDLYDFNASTLRVLSAEKAIEDQRAYIATLRSPSEGLRRAETSLSELVEMAIIAKKSHLLIMEVLLARERDGNAQPAFE